MWCSLICTVQFNLIRIETEIEIKLSAHSFHEQAAEVREHKQENEPSLQQVQL